MRELYFLILTNVVFVMGRMESEPPETNFFLMNIPLNAAGQQSSVVFYTNSSSNNAEPLCLYENSNSSNLALLAHKICTASQFPTFLQASLVRPTLTFSQTFETVSALSCHQDDLYEIVCNRSSTRPSPCSFLQVTCGACHHHVQLQPNTSLQLMSPLYPVLQPGLICQYDLNLPRDVRADIFIKVADLSLDPAKSSGSEEHCVNSFVHILSGATFSDLTSIATICGEVFYPGESSFYKVRNSVVRLMLVGGSDTRALGRRGFLLNVNVSPSRIFPLYKIVILISFFGLLILVGVVLASVIIYFNRKSKTRVSHPRRRQTWHGSVPRVGESYHQSRTDRIRQLGSRTSSSWGNDNIYTIDNGVSRRLPELPAFNFATDDQNQQGDIEDQGFKVYETLSLESENPSPESVFDERNSDKKPSSSSTNCPPPLPLRPFPTPEVPSSSPLYLTLQEIYSDTRNQIGEREETSVVIEATPAKDQMTEFQADVSCSEGKQKVARHGLSVLMNRIRSMSVAEFSEDEENLLDGSNEDDESDKDDVF
eukprot:GFUD01017728.1.p1 GENE.GFUD01017728.1~~GFUD01017728.1.p1  ORF type:complete len:539 (-),score=110.27 GFUD01017728.1:24-1640(-)